MYNRSDFLDSYTFTTERLFLWITFGVCWYNRIIVYTFDYKNMHAKILLYMHFGIRVLRLYFLAQNIAIAMVSDCTKIRQ